MRIIAGEFRSRLLLTPGDAETVRPMPDRVKESLFGLLRGHCEHAAVLDTFCGTGTLGLEAISRGASRCVFVERDRDAAELLKRNIDTLGVGDRCEVVIGDALGAGALARCPRPVNLAFLDPPYPLIREPVGFKRVMSQLREIIDRLTPDGFAMLRTPWPLLLQTADAPASPEPRRRERRQKESRRPRRFDRFEPPDPVEPEETDEDPMPIEAPAAATPASPPVEADLTLPNALGPESHAYHSMAIHLYMRKPATPAS
ncbi:MAG: RsmD family RNA methyltransferase [Phycisphaerales bacterium]